MKMENVKKGDVVSNVEKPGVMYLVVEVGGLHGAKLLPFNYFAHVVAKKPLSECWDNDAPEWSSPSDLEFLGRID